jgi:hypothetical protein
MILDYCKLSHTIQANGVISVATYDKGIDALHNTRMGLCKWLARDELLFSMVI